MGIGLFFALAAAAVGAVVYSLKQKKLDARAAELQHLAAEMGFSYSKTDDFGLLRSLKGHELFDRLDLFGACRIENVLQGSVGLTDVYLFDYSFLVSTGKSSKRVRQSVFFAKDGTWSLPKFNLKPEGVWQKIKQLFGDRDIDFEDSPAFSERFWLKGEFEPLVREAFSPAVRSFFEKNPPLWAEGDNFHLVSWTARKLLDPAETRRFFEKNIELMQLLQSDRKEELLKLADIELPRPTALDGSKSENGF